MGVPTKGRAGQRAKTKEHKYFLWWRQKNDYTSNQQAKRFSEWIGLSQVPLMVGLSGGLAGLKKEEKIFEKKKILMMPMKLQHDEAYP